MIKLLLLPKISNHFTTVENGSPRKIFISIKTNTMLIEYFNNDVKTDSLGESKFLVSLASTYKLKSITYIAIDFIKNIIVIEGINFNQKTETITI